jgi:cystathionine gamma-synthase
MSKKLGSISVHGGEDRTFRSVTTPLVQTSTYFFKDTEELNAFINMERPHFEYGRYNNPTRQVVERKLAELEGGQHCVLFDSGMSAIVGTILAYVESGDHIIMTDDCYRQTMAFAEDILSKFKVDSTVVSIRDYEAMEQAITPNTKLIFSESPTNPYLNIVDLGKIAELGKTHKVTTVIDSTFGTPYNQRPLELGIDIVMHSTTKYLGGHNDLVSGAVIGSDAHLDPVRQYQRIAGGVPDPHSAYLLIRGLKTGAIRMAHVNRSAMKLAEFLSNHPAVRHVYYPGLSNHQDYDLAHQQMSGFGGVVTFELKGGLDMAEKFMNALNMCMLAPSLGGPETLVTHPASMSYYRMTRENRLEQGILDELIRVAVGLEDHEDIINDLDQSLLQSLK